MIEDPAKLVERTRMLRNNLLHFTNVALTLADQLEESEYGASAVEMRAVSDSIAASALKIEPLTQLPFAR